jgi:hypothetical protein
MRKTPLKIYALYVLYSFVGLATLVAFFLGHWLSGIFLFLGYAAIQVFMWSRHCPKCGYSWLMMDTLPYDYLLGKCQKCQAPLK